MKKIALSIFLLLSIECAEGMNGMDSLTRHENVKLDTNRVNELIQKSYIYFFSTPDSCLIYAQEALELARKLRYTKQEIEALQIQGEAQRFLGDFPNSLISQFQALELAQRTKRKLEEAFSLGFIGFTYSNLGEYRQALQYLFRAESIYEHYSKHERHALNLSNIGDAYDGLGFYDSALFFVEKAWLQAQEIQHPNLMVLTLRRIGNVKMGIGDYDEALRIYHDALIRARRNNDRVNPGNIQLHIAKLHLKRNQKDSCLYYARMALTDARISSQRFEILEAANLIVDMLREEHAGQRSLLSGHRVGHEGQPFQC